jgi:hypothetical protein
MQEQRYSRSRGSPFIVVAVSGYLFLVGLWLVATRQVPAPGIRKVLQSLLRPRHKAALTGVAAEHGHCWLAPLPQRLPSDAESGSRIRLFEDGKALGPAHVSHDEIRRLGAGRFSHWGAQLYFSTSDNSDPRSNGRHYTVEEL